VRKLFTANNILEAQLLDLMLRQDGVNSHIKNDSLQSGVGEIPFVEMWPEVGIGRQALGKSHGNLASVSAGSVYR